MKYDIADYDENLCLRISPLMWISMLFLFRAYLVALLSVVNFNDRLALINMFYSNHWQLSLAAFAGIPVFVVLYAWKSRKPGASARTQWIWHHGRNFLLVSVVLNVLALYLPLLVGIRSRMDEISLAELVLCFVIGVFVLVSKRVSDAFSDFPQPAKAQPMK